MTIDDADDDVAETAIGLDAAQLAGLCRPPNHGKWLCRHGAGIETARSHPF
ncbi:MAG: hypothetical protein HYX38_34665 [Rhodospirillales bacterium]|nr:hypothetical protein [Rhodospirillales bacterium]